MRKNICLLRIGQVDQSILDKLKKELEAKFKEFSFSVETLKDSITLEQLEYNKKRDQYDALKILNRINLDFQNAKCFRILGIIDYDIYSGSYNFLFGRAEKPEEGHSWSLTGSLISITRLKEPFYRRTENENLFKQRTLKEAIHELGHTFGLPHCSKFCIMRFSDSITDTDYKPSLFCNSCLKKLRKFFKNLDNSF